jgi:hypothetical protein
MKTGFIASLAVLLLGVRWALVDGYPPWFPPTAAGPPAALPRNSPPSQPPLGAPGLPVQGQQPNAPPPLVPQPASSEVEGPVYPPWSSSAPAGPPATLPRNPFVGLPAQETPGLTVPGQPAIVPPPPVPQPVPSEVGVPAPQTGSGSLVPGFHPGGYGWAGCGPPCIPPHCWVTAEYLLWWVQRGPLPLPLVATPRESVSGALAENPESVVLFPTGGLNYGSLSGGRFAAGLWLDDHAVFGVEASGFFLARSSVRASFSSGIDGSPRLDIPIFNAGTGQEDLLEISTPGETTGRVDIASSTRLWGVEGNVYVNLYRDNCFSFDLLAGFRYLDLREVLTIDTSAAALGLAQVAFGGDFFGPPGAVTTSDQFGTRNHFYGGQLGARAEWTYGRLCCNLLGKVALGDTHQVSEVAGSSSLVVGGVPAATLPGGIFALPTNIGRFSGNDFAVVPEVSVKLGWRLTGNLGVFAGYNFLYWSRVVRPGNQIDRAVNDTLIPTSNVFGAAEGDLSRPARLFNTSGFWAHGVSFGVELRF